MIKKTPKRTTIHGKGWKRSLTIADEKYAMVSRAIMKNLTKRPIQYVPLAGKVQKDVKNFSGSVWWYTIAVLRKLEVEGKIIRSKTKPVTYRKA